MKNSIFAAIGSTDRRSHHQNYRNRSNEARISGYRNRFQNLHRKPSSNNQPHRSWREKNDDKITRNITRNTHGLRNTSALLSQLSGMDRVRHLQEKTRYTLDLANSYISSSRPRSDRRNLVNDRHEQNDEISLDDDSSLEFQKRAGSYSEKEELRGHSKNEFKLEEQASNHPDQEDPVGCCTLKS